MGASAKAQTPVETCQSVESPRLGGAEAPPFRKGGFGLCTYCTSSTRYRHCTKGSLVKGSWQKSLIFD